MSEQQPGDHLSIRISNEDREKVAQILHNAMAEGRLEMAELEERLDAVYAAKTFADLEPVTRDLPLQAPHPVAPPFQAPVPAPSARVVHGVTPGPSQSIAIMSGVERKGEWVVPAHHNVVAVMGGVDIDLRYARLTAQETTIQVFAFWGGVDIKVPDDIQVQVDGVGFMGAFEDKTIGVGAPGRPVVRITGFAMMGGVSVHPPKRREIEREQRHLDRERRREIED
ncbi:hypothetical protein JOF56_003125 [Kibdelosporangium banguiense]|uniref:Cell wall-active antibiotics response LiaF-like C-terminal domain-containing protein n=1 Tax=Kibdelosporangium banguiense TaxID=1365924 RepID=A0ABS4TEA3_9PSEU|nr:DUF1707 domain-containing protein [Kibdelosporangium banguiense]MBP2322740.1 hypothetical protein [Kibdelosporangium banguiense]